MLMAWSTGHGPTNSRGSEESIVGEGADSFLFNFVAFYGVFELKTVIAIAFSGFCLKTLYEILATPVTYAICGFLKRAEDEDKYDKEISYNPFKA